MANFGDFLEIFLVTFAKCYNFQNNPTVIFERFFKISMVKMLMITMNCFFRKFCSLAQQIIGRRIKRYFSHVVQYADRKRQVF